MSFNAEQFRKEASEAGYSKEEIDAAIAQQSGPGPGNIGPEANRGMLTEVMKQLPEGAQTFPAAKDTMMYGAGGLAALGAGYGIYNLYQQHQDRVLAREKSRLELELLRNQVAGLTAPAAPVATPAPVVPPAPVAPAPVDRNTLAQQRIQAGQAAGLGVPPVAPTVAPAPVVVAPVAPAPVAPAVAAIVDEAPKTAVALETDQPGSKVAEAVARDELAKPAAAQPDAGKVAGAAEPPMRTGSGQPAFPGTGEARARMPKGLEFASAAQVPAGMAFVPNAQYYNTLANDARSFAAAQDIVRIKGYPTSDKQAREWASEFLKSTNAPSRTELKAAGGEKENVKGIFEKFGANKKTAVKVAGVAGALTAISNLANAQTAGQALEAGADIAGAVLPPQIQAGLTALTGTTLAPGTLPPEYIAEMKQRAALLGSPFSAPRGGAAPIPDWAKPQAGAGRGFINPPQRR
jgi:hypothetical protein